MTNKISLFLLSFLIFFSSLQAQWVQVGEGIDGEAVEDWSGSSVSLNSDGSIVAIGAFGNEGNGYNSGHVRVYELIGSAWTQLGQDIDGENPSDASGASVSLSLDGSTVAIGAGYNDGNGSNSGHVRVFENTGNSWTQIGQDIDGEAAGDQSGSSVSLSLDGTIIAIGAPFNDENGIDAGHVRVFGNQGGVWTQIGDDIDENVELSWFGFSVSLSSNGSIVAVGAPQYDGNGTASGHVRVFEYSEGSWLQIGQDIIGASVGDNSGWSISLSFDGTVVAIGAPFNDENGSNAGHVRVFKNQNDNWIQIGNDIEGETNDNQFGRSVTINSEGSIIAVGAPGNSVNGTNSGQVRVFENQSGIWTQIGANLDGVDSEDQYGSSVSLSASGSIVAVGAPHHSGNGDDSGQVTLFENSLLGVLEEKETTLSFYPNPTDGILNLDLANNTIQKLYIFDITGKIILEETKIQQNKIIDFSNFENGIYIINIQLDNKIITSKILKK